MYYPAFVELGDDQNAYGVVLPDFPGCFSAADKLEDLPQKVQEAVELYFEGEDLPLPTPSKIEALKQHPDYQYDGVWMLFDIDTAKLSNKSKRINITFPENLLSKLDQAAKAQHTNRSALLQRLVSEHLLT